MDNNLSSIGLNFMRADTTQLISIYRILSNQHYQKYKYENYLVLKGSLCIVRNFVKYLTSLWLTCQYVSKS